MSEKKYTHEEAILLYRNSWKQKEFCEDVYSEDIEFYAPMKVFKGRKDVVATLKSWNFMLHEVSEFQYIINDDQATMLSKIFLKNSGGDKYLLFEYDFFKFNSNGQIKFYRPIFDSGEATHNLLGFDIASRCSAARKLADKN